MKNLSKILEFFSALILSAILFPIGFVLNIILLFRLKLNVLKFSWSLAIQVIYVVLDLFRYLAVIIDILGNVILGPAMKFLFVKKEFSQMSYYGRAGITISAATGQGFVKKYFNERGIRFKNFINFFFIRTTKYHCEDAYKFYIYKLNYKHYDTN